MKIHKVILIVLTTRKPELPTVENKPIGGASLKDRAGIK